MLTDSYKIFFAPVQGYTDRIYRMLHDNLIGGVDGYFSPFLRLTGNGAIRNKDKRDIDQATCKVDLVPQVIGGKADKVKIMLDYLLSVGHTRVDINLGCPFPMIVNRGEGAGMLKNLVVSDNPGFKELMSLIASYPMLEVSLKMRLGWEVADESLRLLPVINDTPLKSVTMHARLGIMGYKGECDWEGFGRFYEGCGHKLVYNGDILSITDYENVIMRFPNLEGVMIGRGLLANPTLAAEIRSDNITREEKSRLLKTFHDGLLELYAKQLHGEHQILIKMKSLWDYFLPDTDKKLLKKIKKSTRLDSYIAVTDEIFLL